MRRWWFNRRGVLWLDAHLDAIPRPMVGGIRQGEYFEVYAHFGPSGVDPILGITLRVDRP